MTEFLAKLMLAVLLILGSAFSSLAETSFMSLSRLHLNRLRRIYPERLIFWEEDPDKTLAVLLLFNNLVNVGLGILATSLAFDSVELWGIPFRWGGWLWPAGIGALMIVFGEITPKLLARLFPEWFALVLARPVEILSRRLGPLVQKLVDATGSLMSFLSRSVKAERAQWSAPVIQSLIANLNVTPWLRSMLSNLVDFGQVPVSKVMVPRGQIFAVDMSLPKDELINRVLSSGYSRVPVYFKRNFDNLVGVVYAKDLLTFWRGEALFVLEDLVRPAFRVAPDTTLAQLLREFRQGHNHLAIVVDAGGHVQGLVTLQDVLEAIVGEIKEEPLLQVPTRA